MNQKYWIEGHKDIVAIGTVEERGEGYVILRDGGGGAYKRDTAGLQQCYDKERDYLKQDLLEHEFLDRNVMLHSIRERYRNGEIYTSIGQIVLIAVNPYQKLNLYDQKTKE